MIKNEENKKRLELFCSIFNEENGTEDESIENLDDDSSLWIAKVDTYSHYLGIEISQEDTFMFKDMCHKMLEIYDKEDSPKEHDAIKFAMSWNKLEQKAKYSNPILRIANVCV